MKRLTALFTILLSVLFLTACGGGGGSTSSSTTDTTPTTSIPSYVTFEEALVANNVVVSNLNEFVEICENN